MASSRRQHADARGIVNDGNRELTTVAEEEDTTVRLLRTAGPRAPVSTDCTARVRSAVRAAWQTRTRRRAVRRRVVLAAALAGAAALPLFSGRVSILDPGVAPLGDPVAVVEAVSGSPTGIERADTIRVSQWIETGPGSRVALRFDGHSSVRLDVESRMRALSPNIIELSSGAVYVDTGLEHASLEIRTSLGTARNLGTQFEVRLVDESLRLRVRTGAVELIHRARSISARRGTEITLSASGAVTRPIAAHSPEWAWTSRVAPPLEIDGVPLATFLDHVAREQGWTVEYRDAAIARKAETIVLHGSVSDLAPDEAVQVAIATSGLRHRLRDGSLVVFGTGARESNQRVSRR